MSINIVTEREIKGRFNDGIDTLLGLSDEDFNNVLELLKNKNLAPVNFYYTTDKCEMEESPIQIGLEKEVDENNNYINRGYYASKDDERIKKVNVQTILKSVSALTPQNKETKKRISELLNTRGLEEYKECYILKSKSNVTHDVIDKVFEILKDKETYEKFINYEQNLDYFQIDGQELSQRDYLKHLVNIFGGRNKEGTLSKSKPIYSDFYIEDIEMYTDIYENIIDTHNIDRYIMPNYEFKHGGDWKHSEFGIRRVKDEPEWTINSELRQKIYEDMPNDLTIEEKAMYIYLKMCETLKYDSTYEYRDRIPDKSKFMPHFSREHMESIAPDVKISCYDFSRIFTKFISELEGDIEAVIITEGATEGHYKTGFYTDKVSAKLEAINLMGQRSNDLLKVKAGILPEGIIIQSDREGLIEKAVQKVYPLICKERPVTSADYMERLKATPKEEVPVDFEKRFEAFMQTLRERDITGSEATNLFLAYKHTGFFGEELEAALIGKVGENENTYLESILMRRKDKSMYMFDLQNVELQGISSVEEQMKLLESLEQGNGKYVYRSKDHTISSDEGK